MTELFKLLPDEFFKGTGMFVIFFSPVIFRFMFKTVRRIGELEAMCRQDREEIEYDLAQLGEMVGTEKGKCLAPILREKRECKLDDQIIALTKEKK